MNNSAKNISSADEEFMRQAIAEAKKAPFPFGSVLVKDGTVIASGRSGETNSFDPTAHSEVNLIRSACASLHSKDLSGCTLYSTCEPCPMCFAAAWWANVDKVVFGISLQESSKLYGNTEILVNADYLNQKGANKVVVIGGVLKDEALSLYEGFGN